MGNGEISREKEKRFRKHVRQTRGSLEKRMFNRGRIDSVEDNFFIVKFPEKNYVRFYLKNSSPCTPPLSNVNVRGFFRENSKTDKEYYLVEGLSGITYYRKKN